MFDLGSPAALSFVAVDASGNPVAPGVGATVTLAVTLPDGTTAAPQTSAGVGQGAYTASYTPTQVGRHGLTWTVAGGAYPQVHADAMYVLDPADLIIGLAEAREACGFLPTDTSKDHMLREKIAAVGPIIEDIIGPLGRRTYVETYDGGGTAVLLLHRPVVSITTVVESYGSSYQRTLTAQDLFNPGSGVDAYGYSADLDTGVVTRRAAGVATAFADGSRNVQVTYVSGQLMRPNYLAGARALVRDLYTRENQPARAGVAPGGGAGGDMTTTKGGFPIKRSILAMFGRSTRLSGIA